jgi:glycosyltransferase involved in cell wall biosynthesis
LKAGADALRGCGSVTGVSVVICCYNSAGRIEDTLRHVAAQRASPDLAWEVVIVDNASTDGTADAAALVWEQLGCHAPLRVVVERELGQMHARRTGVHTARYDLISFVDDDNWISSSWLELVVEIFRNHPDVGACGGKNSPIVQGPAPTWLPQVAGAFALGAQSGRSGYLEAERGFLFGAGLSLRREAWHGAMNRAPELLLPGRRGRAVLSGDDEEICYRLLLLGWRLWYQEELNLAHCLSPNRLRWGYMRRLHRGFGRGWVWLDPYRCVLRERGILHGHSSSESWRREASITLRQWASVARRLTLQRRLTVEGDGDVLWLDMLSGRIVELLRQRGRYRRRFRAIRTAFPPIISSTADLDGPRRPRSAQ